MSKSNKFSLEVRKRAARIQLNSQAPQRPLASSANWRHQPKPASQVGSCMPSPRLLAK